MLLPLLLAAVTTLPGDGLPIKAPTAVGMSAERLETIDRVIQRGLDAGGYPGASVVVGRKGAAVWEKGFGHLGWTSDSPAVRPRRKHLRSRVAHQGHRHDHGRDDPVRRRQTRPRRESLALSADVQRRRQGPDHRARAARTSQRIPRRPRSLASRAHAGRSDAARATTRRSNTARITARSTPTSAPTSSAGSSNPPRECRSTSSSPSAYSRRSA